MDQLGINDYKHAFLHGKSICEMSHLVPEVVETIKNSVEKLINEAGENKKLSIWNSFVGCFLVFGLCFPRVTQFANQNMPQSYCMF